MVHLSGILINGQRIIDYVRKKRIDEFEKHIASARKHDFFDLGDTNFYEALDSLRKLRNRIHIQNTKRHFERDDRVAFNPERQVKAEKVLEKVLKTMSVKFSRNPNVCDYVADFELPWNEHFESL